MKTEALEVMKNRRAIRKFKPEQVSASDLNLILEAGTYAPTGGGTQGYVIVAVQDASTVNQIDRLNADVMAKLRGVDPATVTPYYGAPTILLVFATDAARTPKEDCCAIACNLVNAAYAVGLGSCWINRAKEIFEGPDGKELLKKWGLPESLQGMVSIALGYPDCPHPEAAPRKAGTTLIV